MSIRFQYDERMACVRVSFLIRDGVTSVSVPKGFPLKGCKSTEVEYAMDYPETLENLNIVKAMLEHVMSNLEQV